MLRPHVIVVDDDPLFRSLLTSMLRPHYAVTSAADGAEGYYKALQQPPHLAIIDIKMPGWDGLRTLKAFRTNYLLSQVPVMIMTGDASRETVRSALDGGASDYVLKTTLSKDEFLKKVSHLVESARRAPDYPQRRSAERGAADSETLNSTASPALATIPLTEDALMQSIVENWD